MVFGLYNGLFVLPVVFSLIGPQAYAPFTAVEKETIPEEEPLKPIIKKDCDIVNVGNDQ